MMGFLLRTGVTFCDVSDRILFLDIIADRYFCLSERAEHAFRGIIECGKPDVANRDALAGMLQSGILAETVHDNVPRAFRLRYKPTASLIDAPKQGVGAYEVSAALTALIMVRLSLRVRGLAGILHKLAALKSRLYTSDEPSETALSVIAASFERTARLVRSHDQCLFRSVALARRLAARGIPGDLYIGVRLRPFAAHSWVQSGRWLVNDRIDTVETYTPILSV